MNRRGRPPVREYRDELWMACAADKREHAVADADVLAGRQHGIYRALCDLLTGLRAV